MTALDISKRAQNGKIIVSLRGELDLSSESKLSRELQALDDATGAVVIDLSGLGFIDSSGLRLLLEAHIKATSLQRSLMFVRGPENVHRVFRITGVESRLAWVNEV